MNLNTDLSKRLVIRSTDLPWVDSPTHGVRRRMLERDGEEVARATSIVRYEPGCRFPAHRHDLGEEFLVLEGTFCDEHGGYGPGTYVRNPPGSTHAPWSDTGCTLFVKLRQFTPDDVVRVVVAPSNETWYPGTVDGLTVLPLHTFGTTSTALVRWAPGTRFIAHRHFGGEEILVLDGVFEDEHGIYPAGTWIRSPHLSLHTPLSTSGCTIFVKTGHLPVASASA